MNNELHGKELIASLTQEQIVEIYRYQERQYLMEDAENQLRDYFDRNDWEEDDEIFNEEVYGTLVNMYDDTMDCNVDFNATWLYIVEEYLNDIDYVGKEKN